MILELCEEAKRWSVAPILKQWCEQEGITLASEEVSYT